MIPSLRCTEDTPPSRTVAMGGQEDASPVMAQISPSVVEHKPSASKTQPMIVP